MFKIDYSSIEKQSTEAILYLLELDIEGDKVVKFGITTRTIEERVCEILTAIFHKTRRFPYCYPKRFRKVPDALEKERLLLEYFKDSTYDKYKFSGSTELRIIPLEEAVEAYDKLLSEGTL